MLFNEFGDRNVWRHGEFTDFQGCVGKTGNPVTYLQKATLCTTTKPAAILVH